MTDGNLYPTLKNAKPECQEIHLNSQKRIYRIGFDKIHSVVNFINYCFFVEDYGANAEEVYILHLSSASFVLRIMISPICLLLILSLICSIQELHV